MYCTAQVGIMARQTCVVLIKALSDTVFVLYDKARASDALNRLEAEQGGGGEAV